MPVSFAPVAPANPDTKELRLALVCYGGVSLAIYMHGLTKEVHKLVRASKSLEDGADGFGPGQVEHVYRDALAELERRDGGIRTRVVVDIVAGSSAGGINGICLAKALAHNLSQDSLRRLWLENGDINKLIARPFVAKRKGLKGKAAALVLTSLWDAIRRRPLQFPLSGDTMFGWVHGAMREMDESAAERGHPDGPSLLPEHHPIELLVTVTDFYGYEGAIDTYDPKRVRERRHRHVLHFRSGAGEELLDADHDPALAFAARATSAFPGAFPPIDLANIEHNLGTPDWTGRQSFDGDFWAIYGLSDADAWKTWFVDGGVLDNYPFRIAIDAITAKSAATEVDRRLLYLEPDPALPPPEPGKPWPQPGLLKTALGSLTTLPRQEPIRDDLLVVREFNDRVGRVIDLVRAKEADVEKLALPKGKEAADVYAGVAKELGLAYA